MRCYLRAATIRCINWQKRSINEHEVISVMTMNLVAVVQFSSSSLILTTGALLWKPDEVNIYICIILNIIYLKQYFIIYT